MVAYYRLKDFGFTMAGGGYVVPRSEFAAMEEASRLLAQAEATCAEILEQARETYENEKRRGYEEGLANARIESIGQLIRESSDLDQGLRAVERYLARIVAESVHKLLVGV